MKNLLKILFLFGIIGFTAFSCEKKNGNNPNIEDITLEINDSTKIINITKNGLVFKFCLLNEIGEANTILNEGENFIFYFSIENKNNYNIIIDSDFINENFFRAYKFEEDEIVDVGRPWTGIFCEYSLQPMEFSLSADETLTFRIPWIVNPEENNAEYYPFCFAEQNDIILIGEYYTSLNFDLHYRSVNIDYEIKNVSFKINFEIK